MKIGIIVAMGGEFRLVEALLSGKNEQEMKHYDSAEYGGTAM